MLLRHAAADLVLGASCVGCERPGPVLCDACSPHLVPTPRDATLGAVPCTAARAYEGVVREAVVAFKERRVLGLRDPLARALAASVVSLLDQVDEGGPVVLVPVPSRRAAVRERGHDALGDLARRTSRLLRSIGVDARARGCLAQRRGVRDQVGLGARERRDNLAGALRVRVGPPAARAVVVVDDVVTTGASLDAACAALRDAGRAPVGCAVVAAPRRT